MLKIIGWVLLWIIGWIVTCLLLLLIDRLRGLSPEEVYDEENEEFCGLMIVFWPVVFAFEVVYILLKAIKKYTIAIVEIIVAIKSVKEDSEKDED